MGRNGKGGWRGRRVNGIEWMENNGVRKKKYKVLRVVFGEVRGIEKMS